MLDTHYLQARGVMALNLSGKNNTTIMKFGRWYSPTFMKYIHEKISHLSIGFSTDTSNQIAFQNIGYIEY